MRLVAPPAINTAPLEAHRAANALWLVAVLSWIGDVLEWVAPRVHGVPLLEAALAEAKAKLAAKLRLCVRALRIVVTGLALARFRSATGRVLGPRHARLAHGVAHRTGGVDFYRRATGGLFTGMHRGSLRQRALRLAALLANLEPLVTRTLKRLHALWRTPRLLRQLCVATCDACVSLARPALIAANSS